jgi:hypothetical protein
MRDERRRSGQRRHLRLVIVNERPARPDATAAKRDAPRSTRRLRFDGRFVDLAAVLFTIAIAFLLAHLFGSLQRADRDLMCFVAGGAKCD